ncbi:MAG: hypothetical protein ACXVI1_07110, partial [Halobacteriota archaeon]
SFLENEESAFRSQLRFIHVWLREKVAAMSKMSRVTAGPSVYDFTKAALSKDKNDRIAQSRKPCDECAVKLE